MKWSDAVRIVEQKALAVGLRGSDGGLLSSEEALAVMVCHACWDALERELIDGKVTPQNYVAWGEAYVEQYRRTMVRKKTERFLNSIQHKIPNAGSVEP